MATNSSIGSTSSTEAIDVTGIEDVTVDVGTVNLSHVSTRSSTSTSSSSSSTKFTFPNFLPNFPITGRSKDDNDITSYVAHSNIGATSSTTPNTLRNRRGNGSTSSNVLSPPKKNNSNDDDLHRRPSTASPVNTTVHNSFDSNHTPSHPPNVLYTNKGRRVYQGRSAERVARIKASKSAREQQKQQLPTNTNKSPIHPTDSSPSSPASVLPPDTNAVGNLVVSDTIVNSLSLPPTVTSESSLSPTTTALFTVEPTVQPSLSVTMIPNGRPQTQKSEIQPSLALQLPGSTSPSHEHAEESTVSTLLSSSSSSSSISTSNKNVPYPTMEIWLQSLNFSNYLPLFNAQDFTRFEVLVRLAENSPEQTRKILQEIGIDKIGHRESMMVSLVDYSRKGKI